jgi:hypothetical protein
METKDATSESKKKSRFEKDTKVAGPAEYERPLYLGGGLTTIHESFEESESELTRMEGKVAVRENEQEQSDESKSKLELDEKKMAPQLNAKESIDSTALELKAMKADDARVRVEMWDSELGKVMGVGEGEALTQAADVIRLFCLRWWRRRVTGSFFCWLHQTIEYQGVGLDDMPYEVETVQSNTPENL